VETSERVNELEQCETACAAIIGYLSMAHERTQNEEWVYRTALMAFGVNTLDEYLKELDKRSK
jgi:hypothetical protein